MQDKQKRIEDLTKLLASIKADMMNRTLYALTLITAISTPITFLTGIFGMNFEDMHELQVSEGGMGYRLFWTILAIVLSCILIAFRHFGLLEALK